MRGLRTMKSRVYLLGPTIGVLILIGMASAAAETLIATLQTRYNALKAAMAAHDGSAMSVLLTSDFRSVDVSGNSKTAPQMIAEVISLGADPNKESGTTLVSVTAVANKSRLIRNTI